MNIGYYYIGIIGLNWFEMKRISIMYSCLCTCIFIDCFIKNLDINLHQHFKVLLSQ